MKTITKNCIIYDNNNNEYIILKEISKQGGFANVFLAKHVKNNNLYAVKVVKDMFDESSLKTFKNEAKIAMAVNSPHAIKYYYCYDGNGKSDYPPYIIMDFAENGSLQTELEKRQKSNELYTNNELLEILNQLATGMCDINKIIIHRDIKPANILITKNIYKISDYGISKYVNESTRNSNVTLKGYRSNYYYAPEAWLNTKGNNTLQMDVYAMGIVFYQLATLHYPYNLLAENIDQIRAAHLCGKATAINKYNPNLPAAIENLIYLMLEKSPTKRISNWEKIINIINADREKGNMQENDLAEKLLKMDSKKLIYSQQENAKKTEIERNKKEYYSIIMSQIINEMYYPLEKIKDDYNKKCDENILHLSNIHQDDRYFNYTFTLSNHNKISFTFEVIDEKNFQKETSTYKAKFSNIPISYYGKQILAWGEIYSDVGIGMNILLLKYDDSPYGKIYILKYNSQIKNAAFSFSVPVEDLYYEYQKGFRSVKFNIESKEYTFDELNVLIQMSNIFERGSIQKENYTR